MIGKKTWVGYNQYSKFQKLPLLKPNVFETSSQYSSEIIDEQLMKNLNLMYASHYHWQFDLNTIFKSFIINTKK